MAHDLNTLLEKTGEKTCIINQSLKSNNKICCIIPVLNRVKLFWAKIDLVQCKKYGTFTKLYKKKNVPIFCSAAFGGKFWAQVVSNIGPSGGVCFNSANQVSGVVCKPSDIKLMSLASPSSFYVLIAFMAADLNTNADMVLNDFDVCLNNMHK
ncbi:hypothetical protein G9A89_006046 [Geosiphon pyriformis]|nr:hypothetical protein G9A89_006046 [Geosiphon pyriformis]